MAERPLVAPSQEDVVVAALSPVVGGPLGSRAGAHRWLTPVGVILLLTALTFALGMASKTGCYKAGWSDAEHITYPQMCYSDLPPLYTARGLADLHWPYADSPQVTDPETGVVRDRYPAMEYPVGISYWAWGTAWITQAMMGVDPHDPDRDLSAEAKVYTAVNAVGFAALALAAAWFLVAAAGRRPWDAAGFALAPVLALTAIINWDFLAVTLVAATIWAWSRGRLRLTGVLIGLGAAAKLYPLFLLGAVLVISLRRRRVRDFVLVALTAGAIWLVVNLPAILGSRPRWNLFWTFNSERPADLGSIWMAVQQLSRDAITFSPQVINVGSWIFFGTWCLLVLVLGLRAPAIPRFAQLGFLIVVGFLLINKVYSPQYVLWLLPLAVLARPRWRDLLIWQSGEVFYFIAIWWYLGGALKAGDSEYSPAYDIAIIVRILAQLYLVAMVVRDMYRPERDPVRSVEESTDHDPVECGGGEPDPNLDLVAHLGNLRTRG